MKTITTKFGVATTIPNTELFTKVWIRRKICAKFVPKVCRKKETLVLSEWWLNS